MSYYVQIADKIVPVFATSIEEAKRIVPVEDHNRIVESDEDIYMNPATGSVDFESGWDDLDGLIKVSYSAEENSWVEAE